MVGDRRGAALDALSQHSSQRRGAARQNLRQTPAPTRAPPPVNSSPDSGLEAPTCSADFGKNEDSRTNIFDPLQDKSLFIEPSWCPEEDSEIRHIPLQLRSFIFPTRIHTNRLPTNSRAAAWGLMRCTVKAIGMSSDHFSVHGTLVEARAPIKSFRRKDGGDNDRKAPVAVPSAASRRRSAPPDGAR